MELINIKHHDLKHQLGLLRKVVDEKALRGMEEAVNRYDTIVRTGDAALPHTTKENKSYHGFGLRSIQMTAEKYGGEMSVHAKDHLFCLDVILPHPVAAV